MSSRTKRIAIVGGTALVVIVVLCALVCWVAIKLPWLGLEPWSMRKARYEHAADRSQPLIRAIEHYARDKGEPPETLDSLVPGYLKKIPTTGLLDYPDFIYTRFTNAHYLLLWWDLGSRMGQPMSGLWCYVEGDPEHAILAVVVEQHRRVVDASVDRMPVAHRRIDFDPSRWRSKEDRIEMVRSLPDYIDLINQDTNVVHDVLGTPDGQSVLRDSPWELRIDCPSWSGFDVFFYWPGGSYPDYIYGGGTERIEDWAYVHE